MLRKWLKKKSPKPFRQAVVFSVMVSWSSIWGNSSIWKDAASCFWENALEFVWDMIFGAAPVWACLGFCAQVSQGFDPTGALVSLGLGGCHGAELSGEAGAASQSIPCCEERGCGVVPILSMEISIRKLCTKINRGCEVKCSGIRKCQSDVSCAVFPLCPPSV